MGSRLPAAKEGARRSTEFLMAKPETERVENVELDPAYQKRDIDLLWHQKAGVVISIEVKGDLQGHTGNYAFETESSRESGTTGCFLYSEADLWHYHLLTMNELHEFRLEPVRKWFLANMARFREVKTTTPRAGGFYTTICRLVPRKVLHAELPGVVQVHKVS